MNKLRAPAGAGFMAKVALAGGAVLLAASKTLYNVEGGHRAIVFNRFEGIKDKVYPEGTHLIVPMIERPVIYDVRARPNLVESTSGSKDLQMVKIGLRVLTRPMPEKLPTIYRTLGENYNERVLPSIIHETLKAVVAQYNASQLITQREAVSREIRKILTEKARNFTITLDDVSITSLSFGREFTHAIEAKQVAVQEAERAKFIVEKAEQDKRSAIIRAQGEAKSAELIGQAIANNPAFAALRQIEAAREIAHTIASSKNKVFLDSSDLLLGLQQLNIAGKVSFKLSKRKVDENLQSLHAIMFGRKSNVHSLKRNISQFSGFVWTENEDKQRTRIKDKLDKINKEKLLDFCEILDINVKATSKKEEVSAKLLEFLESPCITRDVVLTKLKKGKKRARKTKASGQASAEGASGEKKRRKSRKQAVEAEKENDDEEDAGPAGSEDVPVGQDDDDSEAQEDAGSDEEPEETPAKKKSTGRKQGKKEAASKAKENDESGKKASTKSAKAKPDVEPESKKAGKKASKSSTKDTNTPVDKANKKVSKPKKDEKESQSNNSGALNNKARKKQGAKASSENKGKGKGSTDAGSAPTTKELHAVVSDILKEVDFNTATLADILRKLGAHFKMDLMDRKSEVKRIIEEVINSMSDDEGEEENDEAAEENGKKEESKEDPDEDEK